VRATCGCAASAPNPTNWRSTRDDGRGAGDMQQGNGLTGMRERSAQVGDA
jgi:glucose-6-phosphate-specific signal transduction histidine kinase